MLALYFYKNLLYNIYIKKREVVKMKRFVVSYVDFFENQLQMTEVHADTEIEALYAGALIYGVDTSDLHTVDPEEFKDWCFNGDCLMKAYEVK